MRGKKIALLLAVVLALTVFSFPSKMLYQGRLTDDIGAPLAGNPNCRFELFDSETGGASLWNETQAVFFSTGLFTVYLGDATPVPLNVFEGSTRWLEIRVNGDIISPRKAMVSVPYAFYAESVNWDTLNAYLDSFTTRVDSSTYADTALFIRWSNIQGIPAGLGGFTLRSDGNPRVSDSLTLVSGSNILLTQAGDSITINSTGNFDIRANGSPWRADSITLVDGTNISLVQNGDSIIINSTVVLHSGQMAIPAYLTA